MCLSVTVRLCIKAVDSGYENMSHPRCENSRPLVRSSVVHLCVTCMCDPPTHPRLPQLTRQRPVSHPGPCPLACCCVTQELVATTGNGWVVPIKIWEAQQGSLAAAPLPLTNSGEHPYYFACNYKNGAGVTNSGGTGECLGRGRGRGGINNIMLWVRRTGVLRHPSSQHHCHCGVRGCTEQHRLRSPSMDSSLLLPTSRLLIAAPAPLQTSPRDQMGTFTVGARR